jgi:ABC-type nitrate/sulfonate/bicarbonate transport systems, periplasmic components
MKRLCNRLAKAAGRRVTSAAVFCFLLGALSFNACCSNNVTPVGTEPTKITYAMPITVAAIPAYVALEKGFWKEEGLDVQAQMFSAGRLALDALLAKSAEVMSVSETPLMHAILQGNEIYIVTTVTQHQEVKLIARRDHGIQAPGDLRGKRVATLPGTNSDYFMYEFLKNHSVPIKEVKVTNMSPPDMVTALVQGSIDAYFAWEPHIYYAQKQLSQQSVIFPAGDLYHGRHCVAMNKDYVRAHPEVVEKLIRGFQRAEQFVKDNPDEAMAIVSEKAGIDIEALKALWPEYKVKVGFDDQLIQILEQEARWARSITNSSTPLPNFRDYIYSLTTSAGK